MNTDGTDNRLCLRGVELRYVLTMYFFNLGPATVAELAGLLARHGFCVSGRTSKAISDALRWEREHGRVWRIGRGRYRPAEMPRSTEHRIYKRALQLRAHAADRRDAAELSLEGGQSPACSRSRGGWC